MRLQAIFASLLLAMFALSAPVPKSKVATVPLPMTVGDSREYEWRDGDKVREGHKDTVTAAEKQDDGSTQVTIRIREPQGETRETILRVSETGVTRVADRGKALDKPVVLLKLPAKVGTKWEGQGKKHEVIAEEEVTVAAGKYQTVKVQLSYEGGKTMLWFAPEVGLVRMSFGDGAGQALELKAFKSGK